MANRQNSAASHGVTARPLQRGVRGGPLRLLAAIADEASGSVDAAAADELESARQLLHRRAGERALELPVAAGRAAVRLEELLAQGPTAIDPGGVQATQASTAATMVLAAAERLIAAIDEESAVLSEVLFDDLSGFTLDALEEVATAIVELGTGVRPVSGWATLAGADAANRVLRLAAPDMRAAASSHTLLYELFTDDVWEVPDVLLDAGRDRRRVWSRARLRRRLCASSRTGRLPGRLTAVAQQIVDVRIDRARVAAQSELRAEYLDHLDRGPLTDVDAALAALGALCRLHAALGSTLDEARLGRLLLADAFHSRDVQDPAANIRSAIRVWSEEVRAAGGSRPGAMRPDELARWVGECRAGLPMLEGAIEAAVAAGMDPPSLRGLVDALLLREYVERRVEARDRADHALGARSAS